MEANKGTLSATPTLEELLALVDEKGNLDLSDTQITSLPDGLQVSGWLDLSSTRITSLPVDLQVGGGLNLIGTRITSLPDGLQISGLLDLTGTRITSLPDGLQVSGDLWLDGAPITVLPKGLQVGGDLYLRATQITSLPEDLHVGGALDLSYTQIKALPEGLQVGGGLNLRNTQITSLSEDLRVGGDLWLSDTQIRVLPADLQVGGEILSDIPLERAQKEPEVERITPDQDAAWESNLEEDKVEINKGTLSATPTLEELLALVDEQGNLDLSDTQITSLPDGLQVADSLYLNGAQITSLPENLWVQGDLDLRGTQIKVLPDNLKVDGSLILSGTPITTLPEGLRIGDWLGNWLNQRSSQITTTLEDLPLAGSLYLDKTQITELPENLWVAGNLYLRNSLITSLPAGLRIGGNLDLRNTQIASLSKDIQVGGDLDLRGTQIRVLPADLQVGGEILSDVPLERAQKEPEVERITPDQDAAWESNLEEDKVEISKENLSATPTLEELLTLVDEQGNLDLRGTQVVLLPEGLTVDGDLDLSNTPIASLPEGLRVDGDLDLSGTQITALPAGLCVGRDFYLTDMQITSLPVDLQVGGDFWLGNTQITSLPEGLRIDGSLMLYGTKLTSLPEGLHIGGDLDLRYTQITSLPADLQVGGKIFSDDPLEREQKIPLAEKDVPELEQLMSALKDNGLGKELEQVRVFAQHVESMEHKLSEMTQTLNQMREQLQCLQSKDLAVHGEKLVSKADSQVQQSHSAVAAIKARFTQRVSETMHAFRQRGVDALRKGVRAMKIPQALEHLRGKFQSAAVACGKMAQEFESMRQRLHAAKEHVKNAARALSGKEVEVTVLDSDKGALAKLRNMSDNLATACDGMVRDTDKLLAKIEPERQAVPQPAQAAPEAAVQETVAEGKEQIAPEAPTEPVESAFFDDERFDSFENVGCVLQCEAEEVNFEAEPEMDCDEMEL